VTDRRKIPRSTIPKRDQRIKWGRYFWSKTPPSGRKRHSAISRNAYNVETVRGERKVYLKLRIENYGSSIDWLRQFRSQMPPSGQNHHSALIDNRKKTGIRFKWCMLERKAHEHHCTKPSCRNRQTANIHQRNYAYNLRTVNSIDSKRVTGH
jgi:hypothetical protein